MNPGNGCSSGKEAVSGDMDNSTTVPEGELTPEEIAKKREEEREKQYQKRRFIAKEIIETERTYIGHLSDIVGVKRPFKA